MFQIYVAAAGRVLTRHGRDTAQTKTSCCCTKTRPREIPSSNPLLTQSDICEISIGRHVQTQWRHWWGGS